MVATLQKTRYGVAALGFALGLAAQITSLMVSVSHQLSEGKSFVAAVLHFLGFLTDLTNIWVILIYAAALFATSRLEFFRSPLVQTSALATFMLVMLFQHFILKPTEAPLVGIDIYTDLANHYINPALYLIWWLLALPHKRLRPMALPVIMMPAVLYPVYVLIRGPILGEYPYRVIDVNLHGYAFVLAYMVQVVIGFAILCLLALAANALAFGVSKRQNPPQP